MKYDLDEIIQKYLRKQITPEEKEWLLDVMLRFYNELLSIQREAKEGITYNDG